MHIPYTPPNCTQHSTTQQQTLYNTTLTTLFNFATSVSGYSRNQESKAEKEARRREERRENQREKQAWHMQLVWVQQVSKKHVRGYSMLAHPVPRTHTHTYTRCATTHTPATQTAHPMCYNVYIHIKWPGRGRRGRQGEIASRGRKRGWTLKVGSRCLSVSVREGGGACLYQCGRGVRPCISVGGGWDLLIEGSLDFDGGDVVKGNAWLICLRLL